MKAETLKKSILQYAMQGKLVEQDPNDEPASVLLERIKTEKEQLIKDGKIKKEKTLPPITEDKIPYELPKGWEWVRLGNLSIINGGYAFKSNEYKNIGVRVIRISDFDGSGLKKDKIVYYTEDKKYDDFVLENNDILLAMTGGTVGKSYYVQNLQEKMYVNQRVADIKISKQVNSKYINYLILSPLTQDKVAACKNSTNDNISMQDIKEFYVPLSPHAEQQRIVEKLEQILPLIDEYGKNEEKLSELNKTLPDKIKQSILQYAVQGKLVAQDPNDEPASELLKRIKAEKEQLIKDGKIKKEKPLLPITEDEIPYELPQGWKWIRLRDLTEIITKGSSPSWQGVNYTDNKEVLFITSENVGNFKLLLNKIKYVEHRFNEIEPRSILEYNDILMNIVGASIGRTAIFDLKDTLANINQATCIIRIVKALKVDVLLKYLLLFFNSPICFMYMNKDQVDSARANLSMTNIANFLIPMPPLAEQQRIVTKVEELMQIVDKLE